MRIGALDVQVVEDGDDFEEEIEAEALKAAREAKREAEEAYDVAWDNKVPDEDKMAYHDQLVLMSAAADEAEKKFIREFEEKFGLAELGDAMRLAQEEFWGEIDSARDED